MTTEAIRTLYQQTIDAWNRRDADAFAAVFDADGELVGFDGTEVRGPDAIAHHLHEIFQHHQTPTYVTLVRGIQQLVPQAGVLRAIAGLKPPGMDEPDPKLTTIHRFVVVDRTGTWRCALLQNTPAQFHGRPKDLDAVNAELRAAARG